MASILAHARSALAALTVGILAAGPSQAGIIYAQDPNLNAFRIFSETGGQVAFDDFRLAEPAQVTRIEWWGSAVTQRLIGPVFTDVGLPSPLNFTIAFYYGAFFPFQGLNYPYANIDEPAIAVIEGVAEWESLGPTGPFAFPVQRYWVDLPVAIDLPANTPLWINIYYADSSAGVFINPWSWQRSAAAPADPFPVYNTFDTQTGALNINVGDPQGHDLAFRLIGPDVVVDVAEPATLALLGAGLLGLAGLRRRRA